MNVAVFVGDLTSRPWPGQVGAETIGAPFARQDFVISY